MNLPDLLNKSRFSPSEQIPPGGLGNRLINASGMVWELAKLIERTRRITARVVFISLILNGF